MIIFSCRRWGRDLECPESMLGQPVICPGCRTSNKAYHEPRPPTIQERESAERYKSSKCFYCRKTPAMTTEGVKVYKVLQNKEGGDWL